VADYSAPLGVITGLAMVESALEVTLKPVMSQHMLGSMLSRWWGTAVGESGREVGSDVRGQRKLSASHISPRAFSEPGCLPGRCFICMGSIRIVGSGMRVVGGGLGGGTRCIW